jgi:hypothetical protein
MGVQVSLGTRARATKISARPIRWPDTLAMRRWVLAGRFRLV